MLSPNAHTHTHWNQNENENRNSLHDKVENEQKAFFSCAIRHKTTKQKKHIFWSQYILFKCGETVHKNMTTQQENSFYEENII